MITSRMSVGRVVGAAYALGKGSALGTDTPPGPTGGPAVSLRRAAGVAWGVGAVVVGAGAHAAMSATPATTRVRIARVRIASVVLLLRYT
jgi:hypothetical protein